MVKRTKTLIKSQRDISKIPKLNRKDHFPCGDSMFLRVEPIKSGNSMSFIGKMRHPVTQKQQEITLGKPTKDFTITMAKTKWLNIKKTAKQQRTSINKINVSDRKQTLGYVTNLWLDTMQKSGKWTPNYYNDVKNKCHNIILPKLDPDRDIRDYQLGNGDALIEDALDAIWDESGANRYESERKCRGYLRRIFEIGIDRKWVNLQCNPVLKRNKDLTKPYEVKHHPHFTWEELQEFFKSLDLSGRQSPPQNLLALQLIIITGQRSAVISTLQWDFIDHEKGFIEIPGWVEGLKRKTPESKKISHFLPLTPITKQILQRAEYYSDSKKYIFTNASKNKNPHLDPWAPSRVMHKANNINKKDEKVKSHGWRSTLQSEGQNQFGQPLIMLKKQVGHIPDNKVDRAYDRSDYMPMRSKFMPKYEEALLDLGLRL
tara:strand:- start:180 stop:1469 length:1290 start_codon:yes stop_codon:yes gene_type:complete